VDRWVGTDDMVIERDVVIPELGHGLDICADGAAIAAELSLREDHADAYRDPLPDPPRRPRPES
jgi:hypothetical protein